MPLDDRRDRSDIGRLRQQAHAARFGGPGAGLRFLGK
jgi:hypothetical protein